MPSWFYPQAINLVLFLVTMSYSSSLLQKTHLVQMLEQFLGLRKCSQTLFLSKLLSLSCIDRNQYPSSKASSIHFGFINTFWFNLRKKNQMLAFNISLGSSFYLIDTPPIMRSVGWSLTVLHDFESWCDVSWVSMLSWDSDFCSFEFWFSSSVAICECFSGRITSTSCQLLFDLHHLKFLKIESWIY